MPCRRAASQEIVQLCLKAGKIGMCEDSGVIQTSLMNLASHTSSPYSETVLFLMHLLTAAIAV